MPEVIYLNGQFVEPENAVISIHDRGFLFGDAVYEAMRSYDGRLWAMQRHLQRLRRSLHEIDMGYVDVNIIAEVIERAYQRSELPDASVYLQITRGVQPRRHAYTQDLVPTVLVTVRDITPMLARINRDGESVMTAPDVRWKRCDIKSTNLLPNILAHTAAIDGGAHEAVLYDAEGYVTEAASMAVFCVEEGCVLTTPLGPEILPSITRQFVVEIAADEGIPLREERVSLERFRNASEVMLGSTSHEVCPVTRVDGRPVGDGTAGPVTRRLMAGFKRRVAAGDDAVRE
jgi:D-alanine transaminase